VNAIELTIPGAYLLESPVWGDDRGYFREWFKVDDLITSGLNFHCEQANLSTSTRDVVRGLHYSIAPQGQAKVVTCVHGEIDDVIADVRVGSPTFARCEIVHLAATEGHSVLLPVGVAHGFCVTSDEATISYLLSSPFNASMELEINPFDPEIDVAWTLRGEAVVSAKDSGAPSLAQRKAAGELPRFG
jgi:dTDP-4-dehydrorhamnose 3,5-epimerase